MAKQTINIGTGPNTKTGDPLRTAFGKINDNFTELYSGAGGGGSGSSLVNGDYTLSLSSSDGSLTLPNGGQIIDFDGTTIVVNTIGVPMITLFEFSLGHFI